MKIFDSAQKFKISDIISGSLNEARRKIESFSAKKKKVIVQGQGIDFNRKILENKKVDMLILQHKIGKDKLKERDSGLNHILCKLAKDNNITLAIDFNELKSGDKKEKAIILARIIQNIRLIKKAKCKLRILNKPKDNRSLQALFRTLGADTKLAKQISEMQQPLRKVF